MKKGMLKIYITVFAVTLALYVVAGVFLLITQFETECLYFNYLNSSNVDSLQYLMKSPDIYGKDVDGCFHNYTCGNYPTVFALIDSDGNVIASSRSAFVVENYDENGKYIDYYIADAYSYTTAETKEQITGFVKNCRHGCYLCAEWLSLYKDGDKYIPVSALLYNACNPDDGKIGVNFTDYEPTFTAYEKNGGRISLDGYHGIDSPVKEKYINKLNAELDGFINSFSKSHKNCGFNGGGNSSSSPQNYQYESHQTVNGVKLCFYYNSEYDPYYKALTSDSYRSILIYMGVLFLAFSLIIAVILKNINAKKERISKSRKAFVNAAAHELKTPLAVIANKSECILENISPELNTEYVNSIYDESKRMNRMVKTLLQYNNLSSNTKTEKRKEILSQIIDEQVSKYQPLFEAKNIKYSESIDENYALNCNKDLIGIVIENFLSNAVKFTPDGGEIKITVFETKGRVKFEIFNSGSNISNEDAPHIWEELYSADKSRTRTDNSTGMGLAICRLIFELHKFGYGFKNEDNGVVFYFSS